MKEKRKRTGEKEMGAEKKTDIKEKEKFSFPKWKVYLRIIVTAAASKTQEPAWVTET